jgi:hypothetical protein
MAGREVTRHVTTREKQISIARCLCAVDLALTRASKACQHRTIERALAQCADDDMLACMLLKRSRADRAEGKGGPSH